MTYTIIVDKNGYIGEKKLSSGNTYLAFLDDATSYSQSGLGQVTLVPYEIGETTIANKTYRTTKVGDQTWLDLNLDLQDNGIELNPNGNPTTPAAWYYNRGSSASNNDGLLYNWYAVKYLNDNKSTLFPGWHVPTDSEWSALASTIYSAANAGLLLKSSNYWSSSALGVDTYEISIQPSGCYYNGSFVQSGDTSYQWTIDEDEINTDNAKRKYFDSSKELKSSSSSKIQGYSLRLVCDSN